MFIDRQFSLALDNLAARHAAEALGHDIDAEDLAIVPCGGKSGIPFVARLCRALDIPVSVLHDEDLYPKPADEELVPRWRAYTEEQERLNADIERAAGGPDRVFIVKPSLEGELGIGRGATDKPRRIADELSTRSPAELPLQLRAAVEDLLRGEEQQDVDGAARAIRKL